MTSGASFNSVIKWLTVTRETPICQSKVRFHSGLDQSQLYVCILSLSIWGLHSCVGVLVLERVSVKDDRKGKGSTLQPLWGAKTKQHIAPPP